MVNFGMSPGVCCRTGKTVYNKISCQSLRIYPAPPGFWEQELYIPIHGTESDAQKKWDDIARSMMFSDPMFVSCRHPDCWICMGQEHHPTIEQIAAFKPPAKVKKFSLGILENEEYLFAESVHHSKFKQLILRIINWFKSIN